MTKPTILLADDHSLVRDMLQERLAREGMTVVGVGGSGDDAIALSKAHDPDVVVLDIDMPGVSAFQVARMLRRGSPSVRIIFLSAFVNDHYIDQALAVEASAYLTKSEPPEAIVAAIRKVYRGGSSFSSEVLARVLVDSSGVRLVNGSASRSSLLTEREREVLGYVARGMPQKQIARQAGISLKTVQHHVSHLMDKLDIHDRVELTRFAIREGIVEA